MADTTGTNTVKFPTFPTFNPFAQNLQAFKVPGFDVNTLLDIQRRNIEAVTAASQTVAQGLQIIAKRQGEIARQSVEQFRSLLSVTPASGPVEDKLIKQVDLAKTSFEKSVADARELSDLVTKVTEEATDILGRRVVASLDEVKAAVQSKTASSNGNSSRKVLTA
jgi:phasin family protein